VAYLSVHQRTYQVRVRRGTVYRLLLFRLPLAACRYRCEASYRRIPRITQQRRLHRSGIPAVAHSLAQRHRGFAPRTVTVEALQRMSDATLHRRHELHVFALGAEDNVLVQFCRIVGFDTHRVVAFRAV
jgi:hypothetical protein